MDLKVKFLEDCRRNFVTSYSRQQAIVYVADRSVSAVPTGQKIEASTYRGNVFTRIDITTKNHSGTGTMAVSLSIMRFRILEPSAIADVLWLVL